MTKPIIVTGGAGFIGSHVADVLVEAGHDVFVLDHAKPHKDRVNARVTYYKVDVRSKDVEKIFSKIQPGGIFHFAGHLFDRESILKPMLSVHNNIEGLVNIMEAFRRHGSGKICFASSAAVYGKQEEIPINESAVISPATPYGISKYSGEQYLRFYEAQYHIPYVALRMANVYGPRQNSSAQSGIMAIFIDRLLRGEEVFMNNDGKTTRDYVYVQDVVSAFMKAFESDVTGIFNIGTSVETSTQEVFETLCEDMQLKVKPKMRPEIEDFIKHNSLDACRAKATFGWEPKVMLKEGIHETIAWYRAH
ncbi:MAG: NAD-dependent epimerase/dehydratase family protein [Patescibacteria group bacterium]|jgi:UDP-glucose 4-epimerase